MGEIAQYKGSVPGPSPGASVLPITGRDGGRAGVGDQRVLPPGLVSQERDLPSPLPSPERLAHDLLNYLATISGLAQFARMVHAAEAKDEYLARIESAVGDMSGVLDTVLARSSAASRLPADRTVVAALLKEVALLMEPRFAQRGVSFGTRVASRVPTVALVCIEIKQALLAVLDNALRATPPGGRVEVAARGSRGRLAGLVLSVRDTGPGIPRAIIRNVLRRGYSTRPDGSGLGLSAALEIVEVIHGGRLSLKSSPGTGTVVRMFLPCQ